MALYGISAQSIQGNLAATYPVADLKASAQSGTKLMELAVLAPNGTAGSSFGIGRSVTELIQTVSYAAQPYDSNDKASTTTLGVAWTTIPATPTQFFRRMAGTNSGTPGAIWSFPRGLTVGASQSILIWSLATSQNTLQMLISAEVDE